MNPVQFPQRVRTQVYGRTLFPVVVDVIAHVLNLFRHHVRADGFVLAAADLYPGGGKVPGVRAEPFEGDAMKVQQLGGSKLELPLRIGEVFDQFDDRIELLQAVPGFYSCSLVGVGNQFGIESLAMPVLFLDSFFGSPSDSASRSTVSRVMRGFSIFVFP